jgi:hypothetical protein
MESNGSGPWPTPSLSEISYTKLIQLHQQQHGSVSDNDHHGHAALSTPASAACGGLSRLLQWLITNWSRSPLLGDSVAVIRWRLFATVRW